MVLCRWARCHSSHSALRCCELILAFCALAQHAWCALLWLEFNIRSEAELHEFDGGPMVVEAARWVDQNLFVLANNYFRIMVNVLLIDSACSRDARY